MIASSDNDEAQDTIFPADYDEVISVGSYNKTGDNMQRKENIDIYLPGENIVSTYSSRNDDRKYISCNGSSLSCAMFTGIASLLIYDSYIQNSKAFYSFFKNYGKINSFNEIILKLN